MASEQPTPPVRTTQVSGLSRLILDGAAVLGAILVAFALDAWWSDREEAARTDELVEAIASEFEAAADQLDSIMAENEQYMTRRTRFLRRTQPGERTIPNDSLDSYLGGKGDFQVYNPAFGALSTLKSIGGLERISDPVLRNALGGWSGELADMGWEEQQLFAASQEQIEALATVGAFPGVVLRLRSVGGDASRPRRSLAESEEYRQALAQVVFALVFYQEDLVRVRDRAAEMARRLQR
jgi:hypothetical protein